MNCIVCDHPIPSIVAHRTRLGASQRHICIACRKRLGIVTANDVKPEERIRPASVEMVRQIEA